MASVKPLFLFLRTFVCWQVDTCQEKEEGLLKKKKVKKKITYISFGAQRFKILGEVTPVLKGGADVSKQEAFCALLTDPPTDWQ